MKKIIKNIILTIDYELFFGERVGSIDDCMVRPTSRLAEILDKYNYKMTVFWDILHYWKLLQLEGNFPSLKKDRLNIENQMIDLVKNGHDIQLHIHSHWLDTKYVNGAWYFDHTRYRLHDLSNKQEPSDINTILGCVTISKNLIESVCRKAEQTYKVSSFRAGGYCTQPFDIISEALLSNGIFVDSSTCHGLRNITEHAYYDYLHNPTQSVYKFSNDINISDPKGNFIEMQIGSIKISAFLKLWWALLRRLKYKNLANLGVGHPHRNNKPEKKEKSDLWNSIKILLLKLYSTFISDNYVMLTPDNFFKEKYEYLIDKAEDNSLLILHPKYLNDHILQLMNNHLNNKVIKFVSISEMAGNFES